MNDADGLSDGSREEGMTEEAAKEALVAFLIKKCGSCLGGWLRYLDTENHQRTTQTEFCRVLRNLAYPGDPAELFATLDADDSKELSLDEMDIRQCRLWSSFRGWSVQNFTGAQNMLDSLAGESTAKAVKVTFEQFMTGLKEYGWSGGEEGLLFSAMDAHGEKALGVEALRWLEVECQRRQAKLSARKRAEEDTKVRHKDVMASKRSLFKFKRFLKAQHKCYIRAWRCNISPDDRLVVSKANFFKACSEIGFRSESRSIWHALGKDELSMTLTIGEFDPRSATLIANFHKFATSKFGCPSAAFRALDVLNTRRLRQPEFEANLREAGYGDPLEGLFRALDKDQTSCLFEKDFFFLDAWKPLPFLLCPPNHKAKEDVKAKLLLRYGTYLKAWRRAIDVDNSNQCDWKEFQDACRKVGYHEDVPGAWRALDANLSGSITLKDIDPISSQFLEVFRKWAQSEFGSVKEAFGVFDHDGSRDLSSREFCRACLVFGFPGEGRKLFQALDVEHSNTLSLKEIWFLDWWIDDEAEMKEEQQRQHKAEEFAKRKENEMRQTSPKALAYLKLLAETRTERLAQRGSQNLGLPERITWHNVPSLYPDAAEKLKKSSQWTLPAVWCGICGTRGQCRHLCPARNERLESFANYRKTQPAPSSARVHGSLQEESSASSPRSARLRRASEEPAWAPTAPSGSPSAPRRRRSGNLRQGSGSPDELEEAGADLGTSVQDPLPRLQANAELQLQALRFFPIGSLPLQHQHQQSWSWSMDTSQVLSQEWRE